MSALAFVCQVVGAAVLFGWAVVLAAVAVHMALARRHRAAPRSGTDTVVTFHAWVARPPLPPPQNDAEAVEHLLRNL